ncbi:hypothetical protein FHS83_000237 [Rhizomicrobium palustre]|uniref:Uncharacterized protein n=1 Tax=Rhizomicrobium palustre TaxID=189966 RepID=A0A846MUK9_9PROT|nr:hypothetical protein [Rhizomicrobium palustre]NIK86919.1 hypothetical protein [Rhizomicrobium palustre]
MPAFSSTADAENPAPAWTVGLATFALWILFLQFTDEWPFHGFYLQTGLMLVAVMLISRLPGSAAALRPFLVFISVLVCLGTIQWVIMKGGVFSPPGLLVDGLTLPQLFIQVPVKYALFAISLLGMSHLYENMVGGRVSALLLHKRDALPPQPNTLPR